MITNYITSFVEYLNNLGYQISNDKVKSFLEMFSSGDIDFSDIEQVVACMKINFCRNREESRQFKQHFHSFIEEIEKIKAAEAKKEKEIQDLKEKQKTLQSVVDSEKDRLEKEEQSYQRKMKELDSSKKAPKNPLTKKDKKFLEENKNKFAT